MSRNSFLGTVGTTLMDRREVLSGAVALAIAGAAAPRFASAQTASFDYYISPNGSNSNSGSLTSPWAISALASKPEIAGKRIGLLDGVYVVQNSDYMSAAVNVAYGGTSSSPTIVEAVNPRKAVISGFNGSTYSPQSLIGTNKPYVSFRYLKVEKGIYKLLAIAASDVSVIGCDIGDLDVRRASSPVYGDNCEPIRIENFAGVDPQRILIENCYLHDALNTSAGGPDTPNSAGIKVYDCLGLTIRSCTFERVGQGVYAKYNPGAITIEYCLFRNVAENGVLGLGGDENWSLPVSAATQDNYLRFNVCINTPRLVDAGRTAGQNHLGQRVHVYNNTFYRSTSTPEIITCREGLTGGFRAYNNLIVSPVSGYGAIRLAGGLGPVSLIDFNRYEPFSANLAGTSYSVLSSWQAATSMEINSSAGASGIASAGGTSASDYQLSGSSSCINAGRVGGVTAGAPVNIGAWTSSTVSIGHTFGVAAVVAPIAPIMQVS